MLKKVHVIKLMSCKGLSSLLQLYRANLIISYITHHLSYTTKFQQKTIQHYFKKKTHRFHYDIDIKVNKEQKPTPKQIKTKIGHSCNYY